MELPDDVYQKVTELSEEGEAFFEDEHYSEALEKYKQALELIPKPITDWEASTWLLAAIGDSYFLLEEYTQALEAFSTAMHCPNAIGNPFLHLRLGEVQFELGNLTRASDELARAYMAGGKEIFEEENPKYFAYLKTVLQPSADGEW